MSNKKTTPDVIFDLLWNSGFRVDLVGTEGFLVSLYYRRVHTSAVEFVIGDEFNNVTCRPYRNSVFVEVK